jgi:2,5-diamino-6-(ribosylamino)-4(3H)-pyrimidinone 5'-phosphate reductase
VFSSPRDPALPYVLINMVSSLDGRVALSGRASGIGSRVDRAVMNALRAKCDAVMVGAGTLRAEKLTLGVPEHLAQARRSVGLSAQPLALIPTSSADVPLETNLLGDSAEADTVVLVPETMPQQSLRRLSGAAWVERVPPARAGRLDLRSALKMVRSKHNIQILLVEGGPSLNHALISGGLANELFLTLSPRLLGGGPDEMMTILEGEVLAPLEPQTRLLSVYIAESELFLRYGLEPLK